MIMSFIGKSFGGVATLLILGSSYAFAQDAGVYTEAQATAGRAVYAASCAGCHRPNLVGGGDAPPLVGAGIMSAWGDHPIAELYAAIVNSMPPGAAGSLSDEQYTNVMAFLLQANGAKAGTNPYT